VRGKVMAFFAKDGGLPPDLSWRGNKVTIKKAFKKENANKNF